MHISRKPITIAPLSQGACCQESEMFGPKPDYTQLHLLKPLHILIKYNTIQ